ncbi:glycosyltransferase [Reichenbachiella agarivorans]|uniref:Glycosyltransferase n=1 Tax=Reichenbachiella agarivorans TaxID=2979464 RepID=A0ABY6CVQ1_9BACT|nr:glycosyltransferase [Reichenbachiella agarivorans]UXP33548.1 glycosyltransferase [Reichenbachiella agarivorans]
MIDVSKIAIVHDDLMRRGGAEQVALALHKTFPDAPIYTLCYQPELTYPEFKLADIRTSVFQKMVKTEKWMKLLFYPFGFWAMRLLKVRGYDKVILSSTYASKYANIEEGTKIINYCHNPFRLVWYPESYPEVKEASFIKKLLYNIVISRLRSIDYKYSRKSDLTIVNSKVVQKRIEEIYGLTNAPVVNPPVNLENFIPIEKGAKSDNYLVVSRFEYYKRVDLVIDTFNALNLPLVIIGNGTLKAELMARANKNIIFKHNLSKEELLEEYARAKALIFPQEEDFGITPLEANASGTPVIAYGRGGVTETMIPLNQQEMNRNATAVFFDEQNTKSLTEAIMHFINNEKHFEEEVLVLNASKFSIDSFSNSIISWVNDV